MVAAAAGQIPEIAEHAGDSPEIFDLLKLRQAVLIEAARAR